jgi:hypothetical protein
MTATFRARVTSSMPVPRPVTAAGGRPVSAAMSAAAGVVLPMPISPVTRQRAPSSTSIAATSAPVSRAVAVCSIVMAGPPVRSAVPGATLRSSSPGWSSSGVATPTSTTSTRAPCWRASTLIAAPPAQKLATICAVTSCGHGVTPRATTP